MEGLNLADRTAFVKGKKRIAVISAAASTGISLHADTRARSCDRQCVAGEICFVAAVTKRLQALGALAKGDLRAADASDLSAFDLDNRR